MSMPLARRSVLLAIAAATVLPAPALAQATPEAVMQGFYSTLIDVMRNGPALGFQGRYDTLKPAFETAFDAPFMTRVVVGPSWATLSADQQKRLIAAFTRFSVSSYARSFRKLDGETLVVKGTQPYPQGTLVLTDIVPGDGKPVALNYLMRQDGGAWKAFDVFLDGTISQLATRRSDFSATLRDQGVDGLIRQLDGKSAELAQGA